MRKGLAVAILSFAATGLLLACAATDTATAPAAKAAPPSPDPMTAGMNDDQMGLYQQCLDNHRAVAMSWEVIQQNCRDQVMGKAQLEPSRPGVKQTAQ